jgi:ERCC4-related helicase
MEKGKYHPDRNCIINAGKGGGMSALQYITSRYFLDNGKKIIMLAPTKERVKEMLKNKESLKENRH